MSYNQTLANRIRERLEDLPHVEEKEMMGGLCFMYNDKMLVGVMKDELMCRVDKALHDELVEIPGAREMAFKGGKAMRGYILVDETAIRTIPQFEYWINLALDYNPRAQSSKKKK